MIDFYYNLGTNMISEKRERKKPQKFIPFDSKSARKSYNLQKKRKLTSCEYEIIPQPPKLEHTEKSFLLYGVTYFFFLINDSKMKFV